MKVLLINPWKGDYLPPPAIGYLQAALKYYRVNVTACNYDEALNMKDEYDLVGVSFHSFSARYAKVLRDKFKCKMVCGGHHSSAMPDQMLSIGYDQVVIGEGENALISIIEGNKDVIVRGENNRYFLGINDYPIPDYSGLPFGGEIGISIITSRGCLFACTFCASSDFWHHSYRMRSADNVLQEIEKRIKEGYTSWIFEDDNFTLNRTRTIEICRNLTGKYLWQCTSRAEALDADLCAELYRAGCRKVWLGIESLSQDSLDRCNKHTTVEKMLAGIRNAHEAGIQTFSLFIVGLPGDTKKNIQITAEQIKRSAITEIGINIAWILPGTEIYRKAKEYGFNDQIYLESGAPYYTYEQDIETLKLWEHQLMTAKC